MRLAIRVVFLLALVTLSARWPALHAQGLSEADLQATRTALAAAQSGDWNRAYAGAAATDVQDAIHSKLLVLGIAGVAEAVRGAA